MDDQQQRDHYFMELALEQARIGAEHGEVPVGAVLVNTDTLLAQAANSPISLSDPTAHAEILVLRKGARLMGNYRLPGTTLYVTLEPCIMCMGAILHARVSRLVYGATDPKTGAATSRYQIGQDGLLNHQLQVVSGVCQDQCAELIRLFFRKKRQENRTT